MDSVALFCDFFARVSCKEINLFQVELNVHRTGPGLKSAATHFTHARVSFSALARTSDWVCCGNGTFRYWLRYVFLCRCPVFVCRTLLSCFSKSLCLWVSLPGWWCVIQSNKRCTSWALNCDTVIYTLWTFNCVPVNKRYISLISEPWSSHISDIPSKLVLNERICTCLTICRRILLVFD